MSQRLGNLGSEIRKDERCSRTLDGAEMLERNRIAVVNKFGDGFFN